MAEGEKTMPTIAHHRVFHALEPIQKRSGIESSSKTYSFIFILYKSVFVSPNEKITENILLISLESYTTSSTPLDIADVSSEAMFLAALPFFAWATQFTVHMASI